MKDHKKSKRKRSYSSSKSSSKRDRSSSKSPSNKHKKSHKDKKSKHKHCRSSSSERQRPRHHDKHHKIYSQNKEKYPEELRPKQQAFTMMHGNIEQTPNARQPMALQNQQPKPQRQLPCFEPSGILLEYYNARQGVSMRFHEPPQSRQPDQQWRMYIFKGEEVLRSFKFIIEPIILTKSCYLIGKDQRVADILAQNPSISRQHAVIQFRLVQKRQTQGEFIQEVKPYVMDLQTTNGTTLNDEKIEPGRYYELLHRDVLKFGFSDRQYVLVKWEQNQTEEQQE